MSISRRDWLRLTAMGACGASLSGWLPAFAEQTATSPERRRSCILLWMPGGPSQVDTFDPKPGHANNGPFAAIQTASSGVSISEHLPKLAKLSSHLAIVRSMSTKEGDHSRASHLVRTGYLASGPIRYPTMGSLVSKELERPDAEIPDYVSIAPVNAFNPAAWGSGFLGPKYGPLVVGGQNQFQVNGYNDTMLRVQDLEAPQRLTIARQDARLGLLHELEDDFTGSRPGLPTASHRTAYAQAVRMMRSSASGAFNLQNEPAALRDAYGRNMFGQGCLLARRLIEKGVPFVEVSLAGAPGLNTFGWDTHQNNFEAVKNLSGVLDAGWGTLITDLKDRGLLESTLIVWMGEFGRTPVINGTTGRDHFPTAWSAVLAGAVRGGQTIGTTNEGGTAVADRPVSHADLMATICRALGLDPTRQNLSNVGRPIRLADPESKPIPEVLL
jgi:uncharacterized protein (DUF1501 family)